eukprot:Lankesteria_metandrocarpae@DN3356_c0_g1_i1.p1
MTSFTKHCELLDELKDQRIPELLSSADGNVLTLFENVDRDIKLLQNHAVKYRTKVSEKNPDLMVYGDNMKLRVQAFLTTCEDVYTTYEDIVLPFYEHTLKRTAKCTSPPLSNPEHDEATAAARRNAEATINAERERERNHARKLEEDAEREELQRRMTAEKQSRAQLVLKERAAALAEVQKVDDLLSTRRVQLGHVRAAVEGCRDGIITAAKALQILRFSLFIDRMHDIMRRLVSNPEQAAAQLLSISNVDFRTTISAVPGHVWLLRCVGYQLKCRKECGPLIAMAKREEAVESEILSDESDEDLFWVASEPNPLTDYESWKAWWSCVKACLLYVEDVSKNVTATRRDSSQVQDVLNVVEKSFSNIKFGTDHNII